MVKIIISIFLSLFFLGATLLITQNWVVAILVAFFVLFFAFFGLSLVTVARFGDEI